MALHGDDHRLGRAAVAVGAVIIAVVTLAPGQGHEATRTIRVCIDCAPAWRADFLANVALFVPFAYGLRRMGMSLWRCVLLAAVVTVVVECLQMVVPGRDPSLADMLANLCGGVLGALVGGRAPWHLLAPPAARRIWIAALAVWIGIVVVGAIGLRPAQVTSPLIVRTNVSHDGIAEYGGHVSSVTTGSHPSRFDGAAGAAAQPETLQIALELQPATDVRKSAAIAGVEDTVGSLMTITHGGRDLILDRETVGSRYAFHDPELRMRRAFPPSGDGVPMRIVALATPAERRLEVARETSRVSSTLRIGPMLAWILIAPGGGRQERFTTLGTLLWGALLTAPLGYASQLAWRDVRGRVIGALATAATVVAVFVAVVTAFGLALPLSDWVGAGTGLVIGVLAGGARLARVRPHSSAESPPPGLTLSMVGR